MRFVCLILFLSTASSWAADKAIDFNRDIRPILSNNCFACHGPDDKERKGDLRLDTFDGAKKALVVGKPDASELLKRVVSADRTEAMPPPKTGKKLTANEVALLRRWITEGAAYAQHWAYVVPQRPELPAGSAKHPVDRFVQARLTKEGLKPSPEADRYTLARRLALDITGLPPTLAEVDAFVKDMAPNAVEKFVDQQIAKETYGEHWARLWLDLARYADSAGYADDPLRTIWAFRDYTIKSFNKNKPFDQFTREQIAGDLLPGATAEQIIATAFHRNTLTNNEGGTNDEEFRNVAVVDRVNTTMTVWMGTSIACSQCHNHKYDPISQKEYFQLFALLNNTADADRGDESPLHTFFSDEQLKQRDQWEAAISAIEQKFKSPPASVKTGQAAWEAKLTRAPKWLVATPTSAKSKAGTTLTIRPNGDVFAEKASKTDTYTVELPLNQPRLTGFRVDVLPDPKLPGQGPGYANGNFILSRVSATLVPPEAAKLNGRYVRITLPGANRYLSLAEVQVFNGTENLALKGSASQISTDYDGPAKLAIDGNTNGKFEGKSVTHTATNNDPWWEVDLKESKGVDRIVVWNRLDGVQGRLAGFQIELLDDKRQVVWKGEGKEAPNPSKEFRLGGARPVSFDAAYADHEQAGYEAATVLTENPKKQNGWAIGGSLGKAHSLTLLPTAAHDVPAGSKLVVTLEQTGSMANHTLGLFRLSTTDEAGIADSAKVPAAILQALAIPVAQRTPAQQTAIADHYVQQVAPEFAADRTTRANLSKMLASQKPSTVPIMKELPANQRRKTKIQLRGNFMDLAEEVSEGVPAIFPPLPKEAPKDRLALANWLVAPENPLTARVLANRYWEQLFGVGLVRSSEEFGIQGELPVNAELLDWLATELVRLKWDMKAFLKMLVLSDAYRQTSKVTKEQLEKDPENRLLARGPRLRLTAEMVRDQALAASGLLSAKLYGPSVKPPQPPLGINAAFGGSIDWKTSEGEDRYRRGLYTEWRRSNPYPSMSTFDAPNRDICMVRRNRTNTPLQALVTLNDAVYVETAQALARRTMKDGGASPTEKVIYAFRQCLTRIPKDEEVKRLVTLYEQAKAGLAADPVKAKQLATVPLGPEPAGFSTVELAAWTVVGNVLLNLDETLMKP